MVQGELRLALGEMAQSRLFISANKLEDYEVWKYFVCINPLYENNYPSNSFFVGSELTNVLQKWILGEILDVFQVVVCFVLPLDLFLGVSRVNSLQDA